MHTRGTSKALARALQFLVPVRSVLAEQVHGYIVEGGGDISRRYRRNYR